MQYLGGKSRIAKHIAPILAAAWSEGMDYYEPFVGAGSVLVEFCKLVPNARKIASDIHPDLILMWKALQQEWIPPVCVSEEQYHSLRLETPSALRGFVGFGCSFGGKIWGGYARNSRNDNFAAQSSNSLQRKVKHVMAAQFTCCDYRDLHPVNSVIYCDPPYNERTQYANAFDHAVFWQTMREWSHRNKVFVSEYKAPDDFAPVLRIERNQELRNRHGIREPVTDCVFQLTT